MATLSDFNGQASFTIGGNSFNNRASSGTPIYERTGGGSGGGSTLAIEYYDIKGSVAGGGGMAYATMTGGTSLSQAVGNESTGISIDSSKTYYLLGTEGINGDAQMYQFSLNKIPADRPPLMPKFVRVPVLTDPTSFPFGQDLQDRTSAELQNAATWYQYGSGTSIVVFFIFIYNGKLYCTGGSSSYPLRLHFLVS